MYLSCSPVKSTNLKQSFEFHSSHILLYYFILTLLWLQCDNDTTLLSIISNFLIFSAHQFHIMIQFDCCECCELWGAVTGVSLDPPVHCRQELVPGQPDTCHHTCHHTYLSSHLPGRCGHHIADMCHLLADIWYCGFYSRQSFHSIETDLCVMSNIEIIDCIVAQFPNS